MRYNPTDVTSTYAAIAALNSNFSDIQALFEKCVFTDGETPNSMQAVLDMNHFNINNLGAPSNSNDAVRLIDLQSTINSRNLGFVTPEQYGATGNGTTDDSVAIQKALDTGLCVRFAPKTVYAIGTTLRAGNGTSTTVSTVNSVSLEGSTAGAGASEFAPAVKPTCLKWIGAAGGTMMTVLGPIVGCNIKGIFFDCNNLALSAIRTFHMLSSTWQDITASRYTGGTCFVHEAYAAVGGKFANGAQKNTFINVRAVNPGTGGRGMRVGIASGFVNGMLDVAQATFINCEFAYDGTDNTAFGILLQFCDNITFIETSTLPQGGVLGVGVWVLPPTGTGNFARFPQEISFLNCPIQGGFSLDAGWAPLSGIVCFPYPSADGEAIPSSPYLTGMDFNGKWFGPLALFEKTSGSVLTPPAGSQQLFIDSSDHKLKRKDSSGTVTIIG